MDIKELDKKQLILLTLLITFVVSVATGIVTVSLMNQMPKSVPQTINNVIQRTIEKVTTVETPVKVTEPITKVNAGLTLGDGDAVVSIYPKDYVSNGDVNATSQVENTSVETNKELGQGIIISDIGLVLVDSSILNDSLSYKIILNKINFDATVLKKFGNGFTILKISEKKNETLSPDNSAKTISSN